MSHDLRQRLHVAQVTVIEAEVAVARAIRICEAVLHPDGLELARKDAQRFMDDYSSTSGASREGQDAR